MKFTTIKLILIILTLIFLIILGLYVLYNILNVKEKFNVNSNSTSSSPLPDLKSTIDEYSNILITRAPSIINDINIDILPKQIDDQMSSMIPIISGNIASLNEITLIRKENINKIESQMDGTFIPVGVPVGKPVEKLVQEPVEKLDEKPIKKLDETFQNIPKTNWRTEWNEKIKIYNANTTNDSSLTNTNPHIDKTNLETKFYIINNPDLENNLNETTAEIIAHNFQNISKKFESELLKS